MIEYHDRVWLSIQGYSAGQRVSSGKEFSAAEEEYQRNSQTTDRDEESGMIRNGRITGW